MNRVVITGLGAVSPLGNNVKDLWSNLLKGVSGCNEITRFDTANSKTKFACEVKNFDPLNHFDRKEVRRLDRFGWYGLVATREAIEDSGLDLTKINKPMAGVIYSSGIGGFETQELESVYSVSKRYTPYYIPKIISNSLAGTISIKFGLQGVNYCPVTACASSTQAVIHAFNYIRMGKAEIIVAGGSEAPLTESSVGGFNAMKALSTNNEQFKTASRPFDVSRDGFVIGEGAATLVIESLEHAKKRGARIYAEIIGGGESADAYHITGTHPDGLGAELAMREALREADVKPSEVDYINAHATSTGLGDISELKAIDAIFGDTKNRLHISATKSLCGHLLGATGALEAIATTLAIENNQIHPTINTINVDGELPQGYNFSLGESVKKKVHYALSNSFGFGGHCASVLMKKYE